MESQEIPFYRNMKEFEARIPESIASHGQISIEEELATPPIGQVALVSLINKTHLPFQKLSQIYQFVDKFFSYAEGLVACKSGCSACCHMTVELGQVEADYIATNTSFRAKRLKHDRKNATTPWVDKNRPCPFLKDNSCSIYAYRPLSCRLHVNFDDTAIMCIESLESGGKSKGLMLKREALMPYILAAYFQLSKRYGKTGDIRHFFGEAIIEGQG